MKKISLFNYFLSLTVALSLLGCAPIRCDDTDNDDCIRVLFVGNSYIYENDLPNTFSKLAWSGDHQVEVAMLAQGGWMLSDHLKSPELEAKLSERQWDYVILQEQSQIPSNEYARQELMYPAARSLVSKIRENGATPVFFQTWAHKGGYPENGLSTYESMQYEVDLGYIRIASELGVPLAQVGLAWFRALDQNPDLELWQADGSHPAEAGTYLAACVFYVTLFRESPVGLDYRGNLSEDVASQLQEAAESVLVEP
ncbi:MAG: hypothetical protein HND47_20565 [Chloroflexi bacterium]|nr:hypothetical protein [Chloroflexota bacterium]